MIESTFWQVEETSELEQGLWSNIGCYHIWNRYRYNVTTGLHYTTNHNRMSGKFEHFPLIRTFLGLIEHD